MSLPKRWSVRIRPSRLRLWVLAFACAALAAALTLVSAAVLPSWPVAAHYLLGILLALLLSLPSWRVYSPALLVIETQAEDADGIRIWLQSQAGPARPEPEQPLSTLLHYRRYFGLIFIRSKEFELLIWPDSLDTEQHRELRVLLATIRL